MKLSSRTRATAVALGLSAALALGAAAPASAATASTASVASSASTAARTPFAGKSPAQILALSVKATKSATSVHIKAHAKDPKDATVTDMDFVVGRTSARGTIAYSQGGKIVLLRVKSDIFYTADAAFYKRTVGSAAIAGKWVKVNPKGADYKTDLNLLTLKGWAGTVGTPEGTLSRVAGKAIRKLPTVGLASSKGGVLYVQAKGPAYPLLLVQSAAKPNDNFVAFTQWNKRVSFKAPKKFITVK